jgi:hypothetical protein
MAGLTLALTLNAASGNDRVAQTPTQSATVRGEVLDLECYLANGSRGPGHAACARKCIESGRPVGLRTKPGIIYVLTGKPELLIALFAPLAGKMVTVSGQYSARDGIVALANPRLVSR